MPGNATISTAPTTLQASNSLADLAARIRAEHEACEGALKRGLQHAIAAGKMLIEAKEQLDHGQWLPWLREHCNVSERTAQSYMRVARAYDSLDDSKAQRVADLSLRDAISSLAREDRFGKVTKSYQRALIRARNEGHLETPRALLPTPTSFRRTRKVRVARKRGERKWMVAIGPDITRQELKQREQAARQTEPVQSLQRDHDELIERAAALEAEAKAIRKNADTVKHAIADQVKELVGPANPFTETYTFQSTDDVSDEELAELEQERLVDRLLAARDGSDDTLVGLDCGYWGDLTLMHTWQEPRTRFRGTGWTKMGSPEWLKELFPNDKSAVDSDPTTSLPLIALPDESAHD